MKSPINLIHLKYFCDAVIYGSISESAKTNFVTQSAVSQAIVKLEICLGVPIVIHTRQKFQVTDDGKIVFEQARHIFQSVKEIQDKVNLNKKTITGHFKFVSTNSLGMSFIAPFYKKMRLSYPQIEINYQLGNQSVIRNALRQGDVEFAIVVYDQNFSQFSKIPLKQGFFHLYQNKDAAISLLEEGILVDNVCGMHVENLCESYQDSNQSTLKIQSELSGWEIVARFAEMNIGVGFLPDYIVANNRYPSFQIHPMDIPTFEYKICAIYNKGENLSRAVKVYLDQFSLEH